ncbi:hypothetical protein EFO98_12120 [Lactiplantibacillus argentoratensis]|uniref:hypothetical protein n=1 Tax=Lactiplantibacillus argentoratensis TaxID=271881 RepID=UPI0021A9FC73|nr:hypothetical protein [Lactiplantibacillus argentoratensis]MCT4444451.1 hypothetical protein [Lactiplantibacillus argentoratensis]
MKIRKKIILRLLAEITICGFGLVTLAGCQKDSIYQSNTATKKVFSNHTNNETEKKTPVTFVKSSYQKSRIWYVVDADGFNKNKQKTIPNSVVITKDGKAKIYQTIDYSTEYSYKLDAQYRDQKKFSDIGTYAKLSNSQVDKKAGIAEQAQYQLNKLYLSDYSPNAKIDNYQAPQFIKLKTKVSNDDEIVTIPNGWRPKIMYNASPNIALDQDQIDATLNLTVPLTSAIKINHQKFVGYQSQNGRFLYLTKQLNGDALAKHDKIN